MHKLLIIFILSSMLSFSGFSQNSNDVSSKMSLSTIATVNQGNSYITFPTDIGNIAPLWFEGNVIPNFMIRKSKNARLIGVLTPQIVLRMFREESAPVRTPSYMPQITIYYSLLSNPKSDQYSVFGRFAHHSNGQEDNFYLPNGEINLLSGNFSTNFIEFGVVNNHYNKQLNAVQFYSTSLEIHPPGWSIVELEGKYSMVRWHNGFSIYKIPIGKKTNNKTRARISLKAEAMWMFGNINDWQQLSLHRLNVNLTFYYHPKFLEDIGLFVQVYNGMDYYNIYFNQRLKIIRFGIMTEILKF